jgi:hypothetical protein
MPNVVGAIDGTHIAIIKPSDVFAKDYYYHKIGSYSIVAQAMVDNQKKLPMCMWDCLIM